ncbi:hypothetical protein ACFLZ7_03355 [Nanoarchaeota archaeon]
MIKRGGFKLPDLNKGAYWILYFMAAVSGLYGLIALFTVSVLMGVSALITAAIYFSLAHFIRKGKEVAIVVAIIVLFIDFIATGMNASFLNLATILKFIVFLFLVIDYIQKKYPGLLPIR